MSSRIELGCRGHYCLDCYWYRHTRVGNYRISTVGDAYVNGERHSLSGDHYFETMVFNLDPDKGDSCMNDACGCGEAINYLSIDLSVYKTAGEARVGHEKMVEKYIKVLDQEQAGEKE